MHKVSLGLLCSLLLIKHQNFPFAGSAGLKGLLGIPENPQREISKSFKKTRSLGSNRLKPVTQNFLL